jgi:hypothetical protein
MSEVSAWRGRKVQLNSHLALDKGKPVARRGRKAEGLTETVWLPGAPSAKEVPPHIGSNSCNHIFVCFRPAF